MTDLTVTRSMTLRMMVGCLISLLVNWLYNLSDSCVTVSAYNQCSITYREIHTPLPYIVDAEYRRQSADVRI
jgi:hypothetical protein